MPTSFMRCLLALLLALSTCRAAGPWVSGYYPGWEHERVPAARVPWGAVTHLFHFALSIKPDGSLDAREFNLSDAHVKATVTTAHAKQKKIVIVLGGADSGAGFAGATSDANRAKFIKAVVDFVARHNYDGVDIDWEPIEKQHNAQFEKFVRELRAALREHDPKLLLTAATAPAWNNADIEKLFAKLQSEFDQINVMTYVLAGAWEGWVTWHGSALSSAGAKFPSTGGVMPSIESVMARYVDAGVKKDKLGIGVAFHGCVWTGGVTAPQQAWKTPPKVEMDVAYHELLKRFYKPERYHFDEATQSAWLSIDEPGTDSDRFIPYTDSRALGAQLRFMRAQGFGGCIVWHIAQDTLADGEQPLAKVIEGFLKR